MPQEPYVIGNGLSDQDLKIASWWVRNGITANKVGRYSLIGVSALLWLFVLWTLLDGFIISYPRESRILTHIAQNQLNADALIATAPQSIQISEVTSFPATGGRQNLLVQMTNANPGWWAEFSYSFLENDRATPKRKTFILPNSQRYLTELGISASSTLSNAQLSIDDIHWHRLDPSMTRGNYDAFAADRQQVQFKDVKYLNDLTIGKNTIGRSSFTLSNTGAYGYWRVPIIAILYRASGPVAVGSIEERELKPQENREITIDWFENLSGVSKVELQANVNILDPSVYLPTTRFGQ
ncbi:MAG: hypothetical protein Q7R83_02405 [bacterium]|nr:hypothetical protein [bacterium]